MPSASVSIGTDGGRQAMTLDRNGNSLRITDALGASGMISSRPPNKCRPRFTVNPQVLVYVVKKSRTTGSPGSPSSTLSTSIHSVASFGGPPLLVPPPPHAVRPTKIDRAVMQTITDRFMISPPCSRTKYRRRFQLASYLEVVSGWVTWGITVCTSSPCSCTTQAIYGHKTQMRVTFVLHSAREDSDQQKARTVSPRQPTPGNPPGYGL